MAKALSMGFLGKQIDGIWHTGLVTYGSEYFYGGGIQACRPGGSMAGAPGQVIDIGFTRIQPATFHEFLRGVAHRFTAQTYSLLEHNCNNFTNECCLFLTGKPIPAFITGLPAEALATPFGAMLRPMIAQMEGQMRGGGQAGGGMIPWGQESLQLPTSFAQPDRMVPAVSQAHEAIEGAAAIAAAALNQPEPSSVAAAPASAAVASPSTGASSSSTVSILGRTTGAKLLTSLDTKAKSFQILLKANAKKTGASTGLTPTEDATLAALVSALCDGSTPVPPAGVALLESFVTAWPAALQFPGLGLMRLLVLRPECREHFAQTGEALVATLRAFLPKEDAAPSAAADASVAPPNAQAMALCTLSNLLTHPGVGAKLAAIPAVWSSIRSTGTSENLTVRLMSATLAFNSVALLPLQSEDSDTVVEALTYLSEAVKTENAVDVAARLLLALGEIVARGAACHAELLVGLEWADAMGPIRAKFPDSQQAQQTLREIEGLLKQASDEAFKCE